MDSGFWIRGAGRKEDGQTDNAQRSPQMLRNRRPYYTAEHDLTPEKRHCFNSPRHNCGVTRNYRICLNESLNTLAKRGLANCSSPITAHRPRSEEHTSELQSLMRISYAVFCLKQKKNNTLKKY